MRRLIVPILAAALNAAVVLPAVGDGRAPTLKVSPRTGSNHATFRVAFKPERTASTLGSYSYTVRLDWRGSARKARLRRCDRFAIDANNTATRGQWKVLRLKPDFPRRNAHWCKGSWTGRIIREEESEDPCDGDEICRDGPYTEQIVERRFRVHVRR